VAVPSRHSDNALASQRLDLLRLPLVLLPVAVAQRAPASFAPAPDGAVGGDGEAVVASRRRSDDALASKGLDLLGQQLALQVAVAQMARASFTPAPDGAVSGDCEAVAGSSRHSRTTRRPAKASTFFGCHWICRSLV